MPHNKGVISLLLRVFKRILCATSPIFFLAKIGKTLT
ncbi:beta-galactosidase [Vibrio paracholerae]|nr:beta-galactosidase [Vibrio paracholerae]